MKRGTDKLRPMGTRSLPLIWPLFVFGFLIAPSWGLLPAEQVDKTRAKYTERGRSFSLVCAAPKVSIEGRETRWKEFAERNGDKWKVEWIDSTGIPSRITGGKIATGLDSFTSDKAVEVWARGYLSRNEELLKIDPDDLSLVDLRRAGGRTYATFRQTHQGLPVYNSHLKMNVNQEGYLVSLSSNYYPNVKSSLEPKRSVEEAARMAAARISGKHAPVEVPKFILKESERVIFPMPEGSAEPFRLCYLLKIYLDEPLGDWIVVTDALRGTDYVRYNNFRFGTISGTVTGDVLPAYYDDTPVTVNLENEYVHAFAPTPVYTWDMSANPGWSTEGLWAWGAPNGTGGDQGDPAPSSGYTGPNVYAYNLSGGYPDNLASTDYLTTTPIDCSGLTGTHLSSWRWIGVEDHLFDVATFEISNNESDWTILWQNSSTEVSHGWKRFLFDVSAVADGQSAVFIRWGIGPTDLSVTFCGWYLDDVEIYANGETSVVSDTGSYSVNYSGVGAERIYADLSGPYQDVTYEDGKRLTYEKTVSAGVNDWSWTIPPLSTALSWDLNSDPGWSTDGLWAWGGPLGNEGDPSSGHTGANVYGYNLNGNYADNIDPSHYLTTTAINCSTHKGTHLRFWRWLGVEFFDFATVEVSNNGVDWKLVYVNQGFPADLDTSWSQVTYDISEIADAQSTVYIRWGMGPTDISVNYFGWNIDDIEILSDSSGSDISPGVYDFDEINVFHHMTVARNSIKSIDPGFTGMDYSVPAKVRLGTDFANAFWDGIGLSFGEGDGVFLRNLALFGDVIYHEYNHGITHQIYLPPLLPYIGESGAMDEAWGDYFACNITDEPHLGEGDMVIGQPWLRNIDNTLKTPDDLNFEVHDDGRIIGGAMWDLREAIGAGPASELIHFARYNLAETFLDYYQDVLLTDDDNGDLNDGTPNMLDIAKSFGVHGIGGLQILDTQQLATTEVHFNGKLDAGETGSLLPRLKAYFTAGSVQANLSSTDPFITVNDGSADYGDFGYLQEKIDNASPLDISIGDTCPEDRILNVTLSLTTGGGYSTIHPMAFVNAPDQIVYDEGEAGGIFGYGFEGGGFAVRFTPPRYPVAISSVRIWPSSFSTGVEIDLYVWDDDGPGGSPGTELSIPQSVVVAGSNAWEEFPLIAANLFVAYEWNMNSNPGWSAQGGWAFGSPLGLGGAFGNPDPNTGATGANVFGYNLAGDYPDNMPSTEYLTTGPIDCSALSNVHLRFQRWLGVEDSVFDNASIEVSNNGFSWTTVWENTSAVADGEWRRVTYNLSSIADGQSTVFIRWGMGPTDSSLTYCGWNLDDVQILWGDSGGQIVVGDGDFYLGWKEKSTIYFNGSTSRNLDGRSWVYDVDLGDWFQLDLEGVFLDLLVRARYKNTAAVMDVADWSRYE